MTRRYPSPRDRVNRRSARALLLMPTERRGRRTVVLDAEAIVPEGRHGVIGMTRDTSRRGLRVSLCVIARDEAASLGACLASAAPIVDEIIVVDTGSCDESPAVALAHGARVVHAPWQDDFAAARNAALAEARGTWVLSLDADEVLSADAADALRASIMEAAAPALRLPIEDIGPSGDIETIHFAVRLFRRAPAHRWQRPVHERVTAAATEYAPLPIRHHGYATAASRAMRLARNRALLERAVIESPADAELR
ncbi:MAG: glycosyltransferase family 2 protein, partial [Candidatus Binatia bacterium]